MIIKKQVPGYVEQVYDTDKEEFVSQRFVAENENVFWFIEDNRPLLVSKHMDAYLPFDMVQPKESGSGDAKSKSLCKDS